MSEAEVPEPAPGPRKTEGQLLLERLAAQCNRLAGLRMRIEEVRRSITPGAPIRPIAMAQQAAPAADVPYFEALHMLADGLDGLFEETELGVEDLARLF